MSSPSLQCRRVRHTKGTGDELKVGHVSVSGPAVPQSKQTLHASASSQRVPRASSRPKPGTGKREQRVPPVPQQSGRLNRLSQPRVGRDKLDTNRKGALHEAAGGHSASSTYTKNKEKPQLASSRGRTGGEEKTRQLRNVSPTNVSQKSKALNDDPEASCPHSLLPRVCPSSLKRLYFPPLGGSSLSVSVGDWACWTVEECFQIRAKERGTLGDDGWSCEDGTPRSILVPSSCHKSSFPLHRCSNVLRVGEGEPWASGWDLEGFLAPAEKSVNELIVDCIRRNLEGFSETPDILWIHPLESGRAARLADLVDLEGLSPKSVSGVHVSAVPPAVFGGPSFSALEKVSCLQSLQLLASLGQRVLGVSYSEHAGRMLADLARQPGRKTHTHCWTKLDLHFIRKHAFPQCLPPFALGSRFPSPDGDLPSLPYSKSAKLRSAGCVFSGKALPRILGGSPSDSIPQLISSHVVSHFAASPLPPSEICGSKCVVTTEGKAPGGLVLLENGSVSGEIVEFMVKQSESLLRKGTFAHWVGEKEDLSAMVERVVNLFCQSF